MYLSLANVGIFSGENSNLTQEVDYLFIISKLRDLRVISYPGAATIIL